MRFKKWALHPELLAAGDETVAYGGELEAPRVGDVRFEERQRRTARSSRRPCRATVELRAAAEVRGIRW